MNNQFETIWESLNIKMDSDACRGERIYRRLDLERETGIRLAILGPENYKELLIEIGKEEKHTFDPPNWMGMKFDIIKLDVPKENTRHISLYLENSAYSRIFTTVCCDIVETLSLITDYSKRTRELERVLEQWNSFFKTFGPEGLSSEAQRGLYGELSWLEMLLRTEVDKVLAVESWKGFDRSYYDFELNSKAIEVKTTMTKEPRRVRISNERQLDNTGLNSLTLYVLTIQKLQSGNETLPKQVERVRNILKSDPSASAIFERYLIKAGYFSFHEQNYTSAYLRKLQETFNVSDGFPRIIDMPAGVGDISYSVTISACSSYRVDINSALKNFIGE